MRQNASCARTFSFLKLVSRGVTLRAPPAGPIPTALWRVRSRGSCRRRGRSSDYFRASCTCPSKNARVSVTVASNSEPNSSFPSLMALRLKITGFRLSA